MRYNNSNGNKVQLIKILIRYNDNINNDTQ